MEFGSFEAAYYEREIDVDDDVLYAYDSDVSEDGNQTEEEDAIDDALIAISYQQTLAQSQRHMEAEYPSSAALPAVSIAQHPPFTFNSALSQSQQISTLTSDQKSSTPESSEVSHADYGSQPTQSRPIEHAKESMPSGMKGNSMSNPISQISESVTVSQDQGGTSSSTIEETPSLARISERNRGEPASVEEKSGIVERTSSEISDYVLENASASRDMGKAVSFEETEGTGITGSMPSKITEFVIVGDDRQEGRDNSKYDNSGKLLPINSEIQREFLPIVEENIEVMANTLYIRDSRPEGSNNEEIPDPEPKKPWWLKWFPWWQKK